MLSPVTERIAPSAASRSSSLTNSDADTEFVDALHALQRSMKSDGLMHTVHGSKPAQLLSDIEVRALRAFKKDHLNAKFALLPFSRNTARGTPAGGVLIHKALATALVSQHTELFATALGRQGQSTRQITKAFLENPIPLTKRNKAALDTLLEPIAPDESIHLTVDTDVDAHRQLANFLIAIAPSGDLTKLHSATEALKRYDALTQSAKRTETRSIPLATLPPLQTQPKFLTAIPAYRNAIEPRPILLMQRLAVC